VICAEMAEPIDLPFGLWTSVGRRKHDFNRVRQGAPTCPHGRPNWRHLANTIEPSVCGGDTVLCQISLTTCYYYYYYYYCYYYYYLSVLIRGTLLRVRCWITVHSLRGIIRDGTMTCVNSVVHKARVVPGCFHFSSEGDERRCSSNG